MLMGCWLLVVVSLGLFSSSSSIFAAADTVEPKTQDHSSEDKNRGVDKETANGENKDADDERKQEQQCAEGDDTCKVRIVTIEELSTYVTAQYACVWRENDFVDMFFFLLLLRFHTFKTAYNLCLLLTIFLASIYQLQKSAPIGDRHEVLRGNRRGKQGEQGSNQTAHGNILWVRHIP